MFKSDSEFLEKSEKKNLSQILNKAKLLIQKRTEELELWEIYESPEKKYEIEKLYFKLLLTDSNEIQRLENQIVDLSNVRHEVEEKAKEYVSKLVSKDNKLDESERIQAYRESYKENLHIEKAKISFKNGDINFLKKSSAPNILFSFNRAKSIKEKEPLPRSVSRIMTSMDALMIMGNYEKIKLKQMPDENHGASTCAISLDHCRKRQDVIHTRIRSRSP